MLSASRDEVDHKVGIVLGFDGIKFWREKIEKKLKRRTDHLMASAHVIVLPLGVVLRARLHGKSILLGEVAAVEAVQIAGEQHFHVQGTSSSNPAHGLVKHRCNLLLTPKVAIPRPEVRHEVEGRCRESSADHVPVKKWRIKHACSCPCQLRLAQI